MRYHGEDGNKYSGWRKQIRNKLRVLNSRDLDPTAAGSELITYILHVFMAREVIKDIPEESWKVEDGEFEILIALDARFPA